MTPGGICYTGAEIDRAEGLRRDPERLAQAFTAEETLLILSRRGEFFVGDEAQPATGSRALYSRGSVVGAIPPTNTHLFLGMLGARPLFVIDVSEASEGGSPRIAEFGSFIDLRRAGPLLDSRDAALLAYARSLINWHRQFVYCPRCGSRTSSRQGGYRRVCLDDACAAEHYPRIDPAVIMLVERPPTPKTPAMCLLGRRKGWPAAAYSTLAGFVEPGESLEEAVAREVREESGITVEACRYQGSQPWPFPGSLMLGFRARATTTRITLDREELADAAWFTRDDLLAAGDWGDESQALCLPRRDSIARHLIEAWLRETD